MEVKPRTVSFASRFQAEFSRRPAVSFTEWDMPDDELDEKCFPDLPAGSVVNVQIMHNEEFKKLEGAWRGLHYLVSNSETDETLKIKVLNISKKDLAKQLKKYKGTAWDQSPFFKAVYENEFGTPGGEPYGCLMGDFYFNQSPPDIELLREISQVAAAAQAPFISRIQSVAA